MTHFHLLAHIPPKTPKDYIVLLRAFRAEVEKIQAILDDVERRCQAELDARG